MATLEVQKPDPKVVIAKEANPWLVILGCVLVVFFFAGVVFNRTVGSETKETPTIAVEQGATGTSGAQAEATKTTKTKEVPSETLLTSLLASGAVLILVGVLYARINSIRLPGGAEIGLTDSEKQTTAQKVAEAMPDTATKAEVAAATVEATAKVQQAKAAATTEVPETLIDAAVEESTP